ncbi:MAG: hypothetical protein LAO78_26595 [Acidobacteriia bacterium]|nr:hypothetical protein [Terriglobia bacterium]
MNKMKRLLLGLVMAIVLVFCVRLLVHFGSKPPLIMTEDNSPNPQEQILVAAGQPTFPLSGNRVVLFFTPACPSCRQEVATLNALRKRHPEWQSSNRPLSWIAVSLGGKRSTTRYLGGTGWRIYFDPERKALSSLGYTKVPLLLLINEGDQLRYRRVGTCTPAEDERALGEFYQGQEIAPAAACPFLINEGQPLQYKRVGTCTPAEDERAPGDSHQGQSGPDAPCSLNESEKGNGHGR